MSDIVPVGLAFSSSCRQGTPRAQPADQSLVAGDALRDRARSHHLAHSQRHAYLHGELRLHRSQLAHTDE